MGVYELEKELEGGGGLRERDGLPPGFDFRREEPSCVCIEILAVDPDQNAIAGAEGDVGVGGTDLLGLAGRLGGGWPKSRESPTSLRDSSPGFAHFSSSNFKGELSGGGDSRLVCKYW